MKPASSILVCGDAMIDEYWYGEVTRISPEAPVPCVKILRTENRLGAADNVAANVRAMGGEAFLATSYTAKKIRVVGRNQQITRVDFDAVATPEEVTKVEAAFHHFLPLCSIILFSDYGKGTLIHIKELIAEAKDAGKTVLVDPKGHDYFKYARADIVKPNTTELREMVGGWRDEEQLYEKVDRLLAETKIGAILLTRSFEGMSLFDARGSYHFPAVAKEVYDVTGAGDTAIAAFAVSLSLGHSFHQATQYANKAASVVVAKFGTAIATREEVFNEDFWPVRAQN